MTARPVEDHRLVSRNVLIRLALSALAVLLCYAFQWMWLRALTCDWNVRLDSLFGVHLQRIAVDQVIYRGAVYRYAIACTMADAYCGTIPLIWDTSRTIVRNIAFVLAFGVVLIVFNVSRLTFSDVLFAQGINWDLAHNVISGVCYFILWEWILSRGMLKRRAAAAGR